MSEVESKSQQLFESLLGKIAEATELLDECEALRQTKSFNIGLEQNFGIDKLEKKIESERNFFIQLKENPKRLKESHITCSNLNHFHGVVQALKTCSDVTAVMKSFRLEGQPSSNKLIVDVVCSNGSEWVKIVARKPSGLLRALVAGDSKRERNLLVQAEDYLAVASAHPHMYKPPRIVFLFTVGVPDRLADGLRKLGVEIRGEVVGSEHLPNWIVEEDSSDEEKDEVFTDSQESDFDEAFGDSNPSTASTSSTGSPSNREDVAINLDITAFFAFTSSLTNGGANFRFTESLLDEQAAWERERPVLPFINKLIQGKRLICCETAVKSFREIVRLVGGPEEKKRAEELIERVAVFPDKPSKRAEKLTVIGKIKERSKIIFGSGDEYQAVTLTANQGFVHAASHQGVDFAVLIHESRALSEQKQSHALPF